MGLQGTLKDFALPDILQLIGIQRKTGILSMENDQDTVTVQFFQGQVVGADTRLRTLEDLLGSVLVRTGKITEAQLREVLALQKQTLQRLGYILVKSGMLSEDELKEALRIQVNQIVYRLFRWRDGRYEFTPMDHLEYDRHLTIPVAAETVLMEAARMIDEWPLIERHIRSPRMVFRKNALGREYERAGAPELADQGFDLDLPGARKGPDSKKESLAPSHEELEILRLLDGRSSVQDVVDQSSPGEFDVHRILYELLRRELIEEVPPEGDDAAARRASSGARLLAHAALVALAAGALASLLTQRFNPLLPWRLGAARAESDALRSCTERGRLERVESALQMFYLDAGALPNELEILQRGGYLGARDLEDPWGRPFSYELSHDGYRVASGEQREGGELLHRFSPSERMILEGPAYAGGAGKAERP